MAKNGSPKTSASIGPRVRKLTKKQTKVKAKQSVAKKPLIGSFRLTWQAINTIKKFWKTLLGIVAVYLLLNIVFASGLSGLSSGVDSVKQNLQGHSIGSALGGLSLLIGSAGASGSSTGSTLQAVLLIIESLVIIWAIRHLLAGRQISVKEAYYKSADPLVPFVLVIGVIILQLLPIILGGSILAAILSSAFVGSSAANVVFVVLFSALAAWSIYMVSSSIFGLYIVTLPDMQPRVALRSAKNLVRFRRWAIVRKVLFLPVFILAVMAVAMVPVILFAISLAAPVFYILSMLSILFVHTYLYSLYRELLA